ncbi:hypothetical protein ACH4D4_03475 [Streptomyces pristinaespiralis]|uniref:hypothetical protein n=1 Tax=Streptomyces pristinaespiralis TaxID=38300 RepID=UPI0037BC44B6
MAERARYVVVRDGAWQQHYFRWGGRRLAVDVAEGPEQFGRFVAGLEPVEPGNWMYDVDCEAAAVVDHDRRLLLLFTWHLETYAERLTLFAVLARTWPGWEVRWAYDGLEDVLAHVGEEPESVRSELGARPGGPLHAALPDEPDFTIAVTVTYRDGRQAHAVTGENVADVLAHGPGVVRQLLPATRVSRLSHIPYGGVHIDVPARRVAAWTRGNFLGGAAAAGRLPGWPGWDWTCWYDAHERQREASAGALAFAAPDPAAGVRAWTERLDELRPADRTESEARTALRAVLDALDPTSMECAHDRT